MAVKIIHSHDADYLDALEAMAAGHTLALFRNRREASERGGYVERYEGEPGLILSTSGSTGQSKLVVATWAAMKARAGMIIDAFGPQALAVVGYPMSHSVRAGIHSPVLAAALLGQKTVALDIRGKGWGAIDEHGVTLLFTYEFPEHWIGDTNGGTLKRILLTGRSLTEPRRAILAKKSGAQILTWYGSVEMGPISCSDGGPIPDGLVGRPLPGAEVRISWGQVDVKSPGLASAYIGGRALHTSDGWFKSGDPGYIDDDGQLHVTNADRKKGNPDAEPN